LFDDLQDELVGMRRELESEAKQLQQDRGKQERLATTVTNQMQADAQVNMGWIGDVCIVKVNCSQLNMTVGQTDSMTSR